MTSIHIAKGDSGTYFLNEVGPSSFQWFLEKEPTSVQAPSIKEAIRLALREFKSDHFAPLHCGNKFTLPERDEHGESALFCDLVRSLATPNGQFFDPLYGQKFQVREIPLKTRDLALKYLG